MTQARLGGIWAAVLTPVDERLRPDAQRAIAYCRDLLGRGCDGINLLGTTGEAMSLGRESRLGLMQAIASSGLPMDRVMTGTGAASLDDAAALTEAAFSLGFAAALVMPPFFFRDASDEGVVRYFDALLERAYVPGKRVVLYNFPRMSGITFSPPLVAKLVAAFPEAIAGLKDSSNDSALQAALAAAHPELAIFSGGEHYLLEARDFGAAGCISGSVALWPELASEVRRTGGASLAQRLQASREALSGPPLILAVRHLVAKARNDDAWRVPLPPLMPLPREDCEALDRRVAAL